MSMPAEGRRPSASSPPPIASASTIPTVRIGRRAAALHSLSNVLALIAPEATRTPPYGR